MVRGTILLVLLRRALTIGDERYLLSHEAAIDERHRARSDSRLIASRHPMLAPMKRKTASPEIDRAAIAAFLDAQYAERHSSDVGPLLGQLALLLDKPRADAIARRQWYEAISLALCGKASTRLH